MEHGNSDHLLLATKLAIPATSHKRVVPRPRLNSKLDAGMYVPFTLITAPAGFGKTTLIGTWIQQREAMAAWVTLESNDDELVRFWRYVIASLDKLHPVIGEQVQAWLQELRPPNSEEMLTVLINALVALPHDMLLVLDNYHVITAPSIQHSLAFLLEHMPAHFHLIIATRVDPPLPLARFRVRGELVELRAAELRFTGDEATAFLLQSTGIPLAVEDITELNRSTEGWAAGLQLAALSLQGRDDPAGISNLIKTFTGTNRHVLNYLTEEVLVRLPKDVQAFLLSTSILEQLNASLCDMVTQQSNGQAMLEWLDRADLFLIALDEQQYWYRYYHLFTDLLRHHLQQKQPARVPLLHSRASTWYEQHNMLVDAIAHAFAARDVERAANLIERCALSPRERDDDSLMSSWLANLPETIIAVRAFGEVPPPIWTVLQNEEDVLIEKLSEREQEVLNLIARGLSNHEIAQKLVVTVSTIKTHLNNIYAKLHVHTRLQAVTKAYDVGVLRRSKADTEPLIYSYFPEKMR
jgi:LuxR family maltose regulon positive regulatory protein